MQKWTRVQMQTQTVFRGGDVLSGEQGSGQSLGASMLGPHLAPQGDQ